jgi:pimeloyl-ACP methyl ester carboxylesterase
MSTADRERVRANGLEFECLRRGDGDRLALCLHGFPDDAGTMEPLLDRLAGAGFTAVAPYLRGYRPSDPAPDGDYTMTAVAADAIELVEALGFEEAVYVGHDWGAAAGYAAGAIAPERFSHLVALAVPPNFVDAAADSPRQWLRSWYQFFFQLPALPERALRTRNFALVEWLWRTWSPSWEYPDERIAAVKETFDRPGTVEAALAYYRQFGRQVAGGLLDEALDERLPDPQVPGGSSGDGGRDHERDATEDGDDSDEGIGDGDTDDSGDDTASSDGSNDSDRSDADESSTGIEVPALVVAGAQDGCIGPELFEGADDAFADRCRCIRVRGVGHFVHQERPDVVADEIVRFVGAD